jgi:hypothetical protein
VVAYFKLLSRNLHEKDTKTMKNLRYFKGKWSPKEAILNGRQVKYIKISEMAQKRV